jgi:hypothetical protein
MSVPSEQWRELGADLRARVEALVRRGCRVEGPRIEPIPAEGRHGEAVDWEMVVVLPDGEPMKGRGIEPAEAAEAALARAEAAPQLDILRPKD